MIQNPYQQNIDIIKEFFKKPIVLTLSILTFLSAAIHFLSQFVINPVSYTKLLQGLNIPVDSANIEVSSGFNPLSINIFTILSAVIFLLFYLLSKKENNNLSAPSMMFKVISIITLVLSSLCVVLIFGSVLVFGLLFGTFSRTDAGFSAEAFTITVFVATIVLLPFCVLLILNSVSQLMFANSIRKSLNSIYLKRSGAVLYGIICFIFTVISVALYFIAIVFLLHLSSQYSAVTLSLPHIVFIFIECTVDIATGIVTGILAIKYAVYIKNISQKYKIAVETPQEAVQQAAQNFNEPVVQVNDTDNLNPYEAAQIPVYEPPQAPVQENFASQIPVQQAPEPQFQQPIPEPIQKAPEPAPIPEPELIPTTEPEPVREPAPAPVREDIVQPDENHTPKFCTHCGRPVGPNDYFCNHCGTEIIRN